VSNRNYRRVGVVALSGAYPFKFPVSALSDTPLLYLSPPPPPAPPSTFPEKKKKKKKKSVSA
jgi:hypothetical protein